MRACSRFLLPLVLPWLALTPAWAQTPVYDAVKDFSIASNPNGVWSYGTVGHSHNHLVEDNTGALNGIPGWTAWIDHRAPPHRTEIARNGTRKVIRYGSIVAPTNELMINPESRGEAYIIFTAPEHGLYRIDAELQAIDKRVASHYVAIFSKNRSVLFVALSAFGQTAEYHHYVTLKAGQQVVVNVLSTMNSIPPPPKVCATGLVLKIKGPVIKAG